MPTLDEPPTKEPSGGAPPRWRDEPTLPALPPARLAALAATMTQRPESTIRPEPLSVASAAQRMLAAVAPLSIVSAGGAAAPARLVLDRTLGQGGMGVVRLGTQTALGRKVAVKTLRPEHRGPAQALDLLQEAWITGSLEHPNVVPIHDVGLDEEGTPVIVLKRIEGVEWEQLIRDGQEVARRFGARDLLEWNLRILLQVCRAMEFSHSRGIVHRDLKPANVMVGEFGEVYVLDWGIAVSLVDDPGGLLPRAVDACKVAGTPAYMAPEMLSGIGAYISEQTDVYLLGATLYEVMAGHPPHLGGALAEVIERVIRSSPPAPADAPAELLGICRRAMAAEPAARFVSVAEMRAAIEAFLEHRGSAHLAAEADARLAELCVEIERPRPADEASPEAAARRGRLYNLFGECRFGFEAALRGWPDNAVARDGLVRATAAMVRHELDRGDSRSAATLLTGLTDPPAELSAAVEEAEARRSAEEARRREIEASHDPHAGRRTRGILAAVFGAVFVLVPVVVRMPMAAAGRVPTHRTLALVALAPLVPFAALAVWARDVLPKTVQNRTIVAVGLFALASQAALHLVTGVAGIPAQQSELLNFFLWFVLVSMLAITLERRMWIGAAGYLGAFVVASYQPEWRYPLMSLSNLVVTLAMLAVWARAPERPRAP